MKEKTVLEKENHIHFEAADFKKSYQVEIIIEEHKNDKTRITYDVAVANVEMYESGNYLASIIMNNFKVNGREPDLVMEQLAWKCRKPLENINLVIARNNEIISIENHEEILKKWKTVKERLELEYSGDVFQKYVSQIENVIHNPVVLLSKLKQDIFISQFFYPIYGETFTNYKRKAKEEIRFFAINYQIDMLLEMQKEQTSGGNWSLIKKIDINTYDFSQMPIDLYESEYVLNEKMEILRINGRFENYGRKYIFNIVEPIK